MFENVPPNLPTSKEPEDIFSGGSKPTPPASRPVAPSAPQMPPSAPARPAVPGPGMPPRQVAPLPSPRPSGPPGAPLRPTVSAPAPLPQRVMPAAPPPVTLEKPSRSWLRVVLVLVVLGGLGAGIYFFITKGGLDLLFQPKAAPAGAPQIPVNVQPPLLAPEAEQSAPPAAENVVPPLPIDSDGDGLTDNDEASLGTDPLKADSDDDGLLDNEEVRIYKSDPMNVDTDGDGYKDGDEVKNGYNPIGPGRLFQVPAQ